MTTIYLTYFKDHSGVWFYLTTGDTKDEVIYSFEYNGKVCESDDKDWIIIDKTFVSFMDREELETFVTEHFKLPNDWKQCFKKINSRRKS